MNYDNIVNKKKFKEELSYEELKFLFDGYLNKKVEDDLMTQMLKAIIKNNMTDKEVYDLTKIFIESGKRLDLSDINYTVDKHSTGGVGDKTTLVVAPIAAACGAHVAKMSGRGLGHTGGTIDKLESIPGFDTALDKKDFIELVKTNNIAITSQTKDLVPMDAVVYALRNETGTTNSVPLIAVSIMSKKIASGAKNIVIDIKVGKGALIKTKSEARRLAKLMKKIGTNYNVNVATMITDMNAPLGTTIGNALEVKEAIDTLQNKNEGPFKDLCVKLAAKMVSMAKEVSYFAALKEVKEVLEYGIAYQKFCDLVRYQNGDITKLKVSDKKQYILSPKAGKVKAIDALGLGKLSVELGAGRKEKTEQVDYSVGILLNKVVGSHVNVGDILCTLFVKENTKVDVTSLFTIK